MTSRIRAAICALLALTVLTYGPFLALHAACVSGRGFWDIAGVEFFAVVPTLALPIAVAALLALLSRRLRRWASPVLIVAGGLVLLFFPTVWAASAVRSYGFRLAARRAEPLVAAIKLHEQKTGRPPSELSDLVPQYLAALPEGLPRLAIVIGEQAQRQYHGNRWALTAIVPTGIINWDRFMYFPEGNYPAVDYGGWIEPIDDWVYVHE